MDNNTTMAESQPATTTVPELVAALEQATLLAKKVTATSDPNHLLQIQAALHQAHYRLSSFLSNTQFPIPPTAPTVSENSLSSATATADDVDDEPMQLGDEDEAEAGQKSKASIDKVEERMRLCFIKNKRAKRALSPSPGAALEERRAGGNGFMAADGETNDFHSEKLRAIDLIYQFHG